MERSRVVLFGRATVICLALAAWQIYGMSSQHAGFLVATPVSVAKELYQLVVHENLPAHFAITGLEAAVGLIVGTVLGSACGLSLWYSEQVAEVLRPFILTLSTLPVFALAPLMIVWFGIGIQMKIVMAVFATIFVAFDQAYHGAKAVTGANVDVLKGMRASRSQIFRKVIVPGSIDAVLSSFRLNVGFSLLGAFIGEFIASDRGLGFLILRASSLYNTPRALAAACGITLLALLFNGSARVIERWRYQIVELLSVPRLIRAGPSQSRVQM